MARQLFFVLLFFTATAAKSQVVYPYPLHYFSLAVEHKQVRMAYMDILPEKSTGKTIILFHGKNFNGYYWKDVIPALAAKGYRVIVPDQVGWGRSDKPDLHYSFHLLANNTKLLLDSLHINKLIVLGHSMGGMLAMRFMLMYPGMVDKLVLENPIGLEDYKIFVPYQPLDKLYAKEKTATYESYKKYQQSYYPEWKPEYEQYVQAQAEALTDTAFTSIAWANAITYQMIYEQPVIYEVSRIKVPTLLIIGQADRTVVGKDQLSEIQQKQYGQYPFLGENLHTKIAGSKLVKLPGVGHIPHIQNTSAFLKLITQFL